MPRPRRARNAQPVSQEKSAAAADAASENDERMNTRGRTRSTRSSARLSAIETAPQVDDTNTEDVNAIGSDNDDTESSPEVGRRAMATPAQQRRDTSGLDLADDDVFGDLGDSFEDGDLPPAPQSAETTSFSLSGFKTRSRKSSIIGRNDPPIRPSSRAGSTPGVSSTFNIGAFKRRAREPSILATSRKAHDNTTLTNTTATTTTATAGAAAQNSDVESEEEGDFAPEAESTPLNNRRSLRMSREAERRPVTRKRKSEDLHENSDRPEKASRTEQEVEEDAASDSDSELSSLPSPQHPNPAWLQRPVTPLNDAEIIAPPASSGSESDGDVWPDIHGLAKRRRRPSITTPVRADNLSDVSSPPSLTHSPNYAEIKGSKSRGRSSTRHHRSPRVTTADLANLLPKRRYKKNRDSFDLSDGDETDQEQSHLSTSASASRRRKATRSQTRGAGLEESNNVLQPKQTPVRGRPGLRSRSRARQSSDKENESESDEEQEEPSRFIPMPEDTFDGDTGRPTEVFSTDELRKATKKFKEVDQWELSFEEMAPTSSPKGAR